VKGRGKILFFLSVVNSEDGGECTQERPVGDEPAAKLCSPGHRKSIVILETCASYHEVHS